MSVLVLKLNATGDVVRTTTLLHRLGDDVTWITADTNLALLAGASASTRCLGWSNRDEALDRRYDLVINLEDEVEVARFASQAKYAELFGAYSRDGSFVQYTDSARAWFDMSLISVHGRDKADELKYRNRRTYQELIFEGLGFVFSDEPYVLPQTGRSELVGDIAIAPVAGAVWPMKRWAYYAELKRELESAGLVVNVLPQRPTLLEHLADVRGHRCLVSGDSLPMHLALGSGIPCVTIFNCTSPWEIHGYGLQRKIVSPRLGDFFYKRALDEAATTAVTLEEVLVAVLDLMSSKRAGESAVQQ